MLLLTLVAVVLVGSQLTSSSVVDDIDCSLLSAGNHSNPVIPCSHIFFECSNGIAMFHRCSNGTRFDAASKECRHPHDVAACVQHAEKTFDCTNLTDGAYPSPWMTCSHVYYMCLLGETHRFVCANGTVFDTVTKTCLTFAAACIVESSSTLTATTTGPVFDCFLREDGNYPDPQANCSSLFYSCVGGSFIERSCPLSTRYDRHSDSCQFPEHVLECGGKPPVTTTTTTLSTEAPLFRFACDNLFGNYANPAVNCSSFFFTCMGAPLGIIRACPPGTYYDGELDLCSYYRQVPACSGIHHHTTSTTVISTASTYDSTTSMATTTPSTSLAPSAAPSVINSTNPLATSSSGVLPLVNTSTTAVPTSQPVANSSPNGGVVSSAPTTTVQPSTGEQKTTTQSLATVDCGGKADITIAAAISCADYFFYCFDGGAHRIDCPGGTRYHATYGACLEYADVPGCV